MHSKYRVLCLTCGVRFPSILKFREHQYDHVRHDDKVHMEYCGLVIDQDNRVIPKSDMDSVLTPKEKIFYEMNRTI